MVSYEFFRYKLPFSMEEYEERIRKVRASMKKRDIEVLMLNSPENIYYLTGHQTPGFYMFQTLILPMDGEPIVITREAEEPWVKARSWVTKSAYYSDQKDPLKVVQKTLKMEGMSNRKIGFEKKSWFLTVTRFEQLTTLLKNAKLRDGSNIVENIRVIKSEAELKYMRDAAKIVDRSMDAGMAAIEEGVSENVVASEAYKAMILNGSVYPGAHPYICSGKRTGIMHASYEDRKIERGDQVFLEIPACVNRYHAAMMRTATVGEPSEKLRKMSEASIKGLEKAIEVIRPGVKSGEIDYAVRTEVTKLGFGQAFRHRTAYSIGIAFPPTWGEEIAHIREGDPTVLRPGMVFHVILSLRILELGGVGFSETAAVTEDGVEVLGRFPRQLFLK
jgi:Xaa-Pro dipeptidase